MTTKKELVIIAAAAGIGMAILAAGAKAAPPIVSPVQSSCSLPTTIPAGQDGTATVTVLAGNVAKNVAFSIQKAGVECSRTSTVTIPGDSASHVYTVTIPSSGCLGSLGTSVSYSITMILV